MKPAVSKSQCFWHGADLARHAAALMREDVAGADEQASEVGMTMLGSRKFMRSRT
jgi:hypothetical protein